MTETIPNEHGQDITVCTIDETKLDLKLTRSADEVNFINVEYNDVD